MPMLTTSVIRCAGVARPRAAAQPVGEVAHVVERGVDVGHDVAAVDDHRPVRRGCAARRAAPARFSVTLIFSPANIAIAQRLDVPRPAPARAAARSVSSVTRCFE